MKYVSKDGQELDFWGNPNLPKEPKRIGLTMSGGVDSSLLLMLICEEFKDKNITIVPGVGDDVNRASSSDPVKFVIHYARDRYPTVNIEDPYIDTFDKINSYYHRKVNLDQFASDCNLDVLMGGRSLEPPHIYMGDPEKGENRGPGDIVELEDKGHYILYRPYYNVNKRFMADMYQQLDLMEDIYPFTASCVNIMPDNIMPCKRCAWCKEKKWAFGTYDFCIE